MKILIYSPAFLPLTGGLENMAHMLAFEFSNKGHEVTVTTLTNKGLHNDHQSGYRIIRNPSLKLYWECYINCDLILFVNISLKGIWPLFLKRKPVFVSHQITYFNRDGSLNNLEKVKRYLTKFMKNISCSYYVKSTLPYQTGEVIHNAYDHKRFKNYHLERSKKLLFVGRLVSDKGVDTLFKALHLLKMNDQLCPELSIIGDGPELINLHKLSRQLGIENQITFLGNLIGEVLVAELNNHQTMVVPSKWKEPFGLVALEGLACGCNLIVSAEGGLIEATGGFTKTFINGNEYSLYETLRSNLKEPQIAYSNEISEHLKRHESVYIAEKYLEFFM